MDKFTKRIVFVIKNIPEGKVLSYGNISALAGNPRGARQVVRVLHIMTEKYNLPWFRVVNSQGEISLKGEGYIQQKALLESEGVAFSSQDRINFKKYLWDIETIEEIVAK